MNWMDRYNKYIGTDKEYLYSLQTMAVVVGVFIVGFGFAVFLAISF